MIKIHPPLLQTGITILPASHLLLILHKMLATMFIFLLSLMTFSLPHMSLLHHHLLMNHHLYLFLPGVQIELELPLFIYKIMSAIMFILLLTLYHIISITITFPLIMLPLFPLYKLLNLLHMLRQASKIVGIKLCKLSYWHLRKLVLGIL